MNRLRIAVTLPVILLSSCAEWLNPDLEHACARKLMAANQELDSAREKGLASQIEWVKAANLLSSAARRQRNGRYNACLDKVRRAREFIHMVDSKLPAATPGAIQ